MSLVDDSESRRVSYDYTGVTSNRKPSLKEMPSFRDEASKAMNRRGDLQKIKDRLMLNREILHNADPSSKPWLRRPSRPSQTVDFVREEHHHQSSTHYNSAFHSTSPGMIVGEAEYVPQRPPRSRHLSRGTNGSNDSSDGGVSQE